MKKFLLIGVLAASAMSAHAVPACLAVTSEVLSENSLATKDVEASACSVPTLSEWSLIGLGGVMLIVTARQWRRRRDTLV